MNKFLTKIIGASLAIAMMIGVGVAANSGKEMQQVEAKVTVDEGYTAATMGNGDNCSSCTVSGDDGIKVGTSSKGGSMNVTVPSGATTLRVYAAAWKDVNGLSLNITSNPNTASINPASIALTADSGVTSNSPFTLSGSKTNYKFDFILSDVTAQTVFTFTSSIAKRFVVWDAQYTKDTQYTVTFNLNYDGAPAAATQKVNKGSNVDKPADPTREADENYYYSFGGWFTDSGCTQGKEYDFSSAVNGDLELFAKWNNETAKETIEKLDTQAALSYSYSLNGYIDTLNPALLGVSGTSYTSWSGKESNSPASYSGNSAAQNTTIQLRSKENSGIVTTASGGTAKKVTVSWHTSTLAGRTLDIYGKNTAYSSPADLYGDAKGTLIGSIVCDTSTSLNIESNDYTYIGIRSNDSALYLDSIKIQWGDISYNFSNAAIRFGGSVEQSVWNKLNGGENGTNIQGFGVMLSNSNNIKATFEGVKNSIDNDAVFKSFEGTAYNPLGDTGVKVFYHTANIEMPVSLSNNYFWNLYKGINNTDKGLAREYTAVAFIKTANDGVVFLTETTTSVAKLASEQLAKNPSETLDDSLSYIANLYQAN